MSLLSDKERRKLIKDCEQIFDDVPNAPTEIIILSVVNMTLSKVEKVLAERYIESISASEEED